MGKTVVQINFRFEMMPEEYTETVKPLAEITVNANYSLVSAVNRTTDLPLAQRPKHMAHGEIVWRATPLLTLSAAVDYTGARPDSSGIPLKSHTVADLRASYALSEHLEIYGRVDNVFDAHYEDVYGYGTPGVAGYGGMRVRL